MFLIAWTGGYENPEFFATRDKDEAMEKFADWANEVTSDSGEEVTAMFIDEQGGIEVLEAYTSADAEEDGN